MSKHSFSLHVPKITVLERIEAPEALSIPLRWHKPIVKEGDIVGSGQKVATTVIRGIGDMHSHIAGRVVSVEASFIVVQCELGLEAASVEPQKPEGKSASWLNSMGVDTLGMEKAKTLIINAVPSEPGNLCNLPIVATRRKWLEKAITFVKGLVDPERTLLAALKGDRIDAFTDCTVVEIEPTYPSGIDALVIKAATGLEIPPGYPTTEVCCVSICDLFAVAHVLETGLPYTEIPMTLNNGVTLVPVGMRAADIMKLHGFTAQERDKVVYGGLMRGIAARDTMQGANKNSHAFHVIRHDSAPPVKDAFCLGCGDCEKHCPSRLMPNMISRCAEAKLFERAERYGVFSCIECGLCGYYCRARRPLLQYIRLAKQELQLSKGTWEIPSMNGGEA